MEQLLEVYAQPYDASYRVVSLEESPKQLFSEVRVGFTHSKGITHQDYEYKREADMYMLVEPLAGGREVLLEDNHQATTYAKVVAHLVEVLYPAATTITLVEDNLSAHKLASRYQVFPAEGARRIIQKLEVVRTPAHGS